MKRTVIFSGIILLCVAAAWHGWQRGAAAYSQDTDPSPPIVPPRRLSPSTAPNKPNGAPDAAAALALVIQRESMTDPDEMERAEATLRATPTDILQEAALQNARSPQSADADWKALKAFESRLLYFLFYRSEAATMDFILANRPVLLSRPLWHILDAWAFSDPPRAWQWMVANLKNKEDMQEALNAVISIASAWCKRDARAAFAAWKQVPQDFPMAESASQYLCEGAPTQEIRDEFLRDLMQMPDTPRRAAALSGVLGTWTMEEGVPPVRAWLEQQTMSPESSSAIRASAAAAAASFGQHAAAVDWIMAQPWTYSQANELAEITEAWATEAPNTCAEWLKTLPISRDADFPIGRFIDSVRPSDPASAFVWTRRLHDESKRERHVRDVWRTWRENAPVSAAAFAEQLDAKERTWLGLPLTP